MDLSENRKRMNEEKLYEPGDSKIAHEQMTRMELLYDYNATRPSEIKKRQKLLIEMFGKIGEGCYFEPPLHANFGCKHVFCGNNVYGNFNLTLVDDGNIFIGDNVMFGPGVIVATPGHPIEIELRRKGYQFNIDVHIGSNVWIGANSTILPGVNIGDNSVIGAGSVVTKDIPSNVVAYGNPCRIVRNIGAHDKDYYYKDRKIDIK